MIGDYGLVLDSLIVILLLATIVYAAILNKKLNRLRHNRVELEKATRTFAEAAYKADQNLIGLKQLVEGSGGGLQARIDRAQGLRDELNFLIETAEALAVRLEGASETGRRAVGPRPAGAIDSIGAAGGSSGMGASAASKSTEAGPVSLGEANAQELSRRATAATHKTAAERDLLKAIENMK